MKNNEKSVRSPSHPRLRTNASRLLAPTTTTAVSKSPFRTSKWKVIARYTANFRLKYSLITKL